jgi:hypothetical protein
MMRRQYPTVALEDSKSWIADSNPQRVESPD